MNCTNHPDVAALTFCSRCGTPLCNDCQINTQGTVFCRPCLVAAAGAAQAGHSAHTPHSAYSAPPPGAAPRSHVLWGMLFLFSFLPGANYMYMGLMKKGLATMCGFFLVIFMLSWSSFPISLFLGLSLPVLVIASAFDGFNIRRRINAGQAVSDDVGDLVQSVLANKNLRTMIIVALAIMLAFSVLNIAMAIISRLLPILVIALGAYILIKRKPPVE